MPLFRMVESMSSRILSPTRVERTVVFAQPGSVSVVETTYFGIVLMRSE